jgi:hypothetical protein
MYTFIFIYIYYCIYIYTHVQIISPSFSVSLSLSLSLSFSLSLSLCLSLSLPLGSQASAGSAHTCARYVAAVVCSCLKRLKGLNVHFWAYGWVAILSIVIIAACQRWVHWFSVSLGQISCSRILTLQVRKPYWVSNQKTLKAGVLRWLLQYGPFWSQNFSRDHSKATEQHSLLHEIFRGLMTLSFSSGLVVIGKVQRGTC